MLATGAWGDEDQAARFADDDSVPDTPGHDDALPAAHRDDPPSRPSPTVTSDRSNATPPDPLISVSLLGPLPAKAEGYSYQISMV